MRCRSSCSAGSKAKRAGAALVVVALAGAVATFVHVPTSLHLFVSETVSSILAYLGLLVVLKPRS